MRRVKSVIKNAFVPNIPDKIPPPCVSIILINKYFPFDSISRKINNTNVMFRSYHYLNWSLGAGVRCYTAVYQEKPIAFIAVASVRMKAKYYRVSRLVVFPDYQGIGVGKRLLNFIAKLYTSQTKMPFYILTSNPHIAQYQFTR